MYVSMIGRRDGSRLLHGGRRKSLVILFSQIRLIPFINFSPGLLDSNGQRDGPHRHQGPKPRVAAPDRRPCRPRRSRPRQRSPDIRAEPARQPGPRPDERTLAEIYLIPRRSIHPTRGQGTPDPGRGRVEEIAGLPKGHPTRIPAHHRPHRARDCPQERILPIHRRYHRPHHGPDHRGN